MGPAAPQPTLNRLRQMLAGIDPAFAPACRRGAAGRAQAPIDGTLGGGLACGALHEFAPGAPMDLGAVGGFGLALAARAGGPRQCSG